MSNLNNHKCSTNVTMSCHNFNGKHLVNPRFVSDFHISDIKKLEQSVQLIISFNDCHPAYGFIKVHEYASKCAHTHTHTHKCKHNETAYLKPQ